MSKEQQPEALRLADRLDAVDARYSAPLMVSAARELRRLHARVAQMEGELASIGAGGVEPLRSRPGSNWVPVAERLPEPGVPVLLDIGGRHPIRAIWAARHTVPVADDLLDVGESDYDEATDTHYCPAGWYEWNQHEEVHWSVSDAPRAWLALPEQGRACGAQGDALAYEHWRAIREGCGNGACDDYFAARPKIDSNDRRSVFMAGFDRGWGAACAAKEGGIT